MPDAPLTPEEIGSIRTDRFLTNYERRWLATLDAQASKHAEEVAELKRNRCEHCGAKLIDGCVHCGAPQCCPSCCQVTTLELKVAARDRRIAELEGAARAVSRAVESASIDGERP